MPTVCTDEHNESASLLGLIVSMLFKQKTALLHKFERRSRKCVFLWSDILTLDVSGRMNQTSSGIPNCTSLSTTAPPSAFSRSRALVARLWVDLGHQQSERVSRWSNQFSSTEMKTQTTSCKHTVTGRGDQAVYCVYFITYMLYSIPTRLMPLTARTRSPVLSFWQWAAGESGTTDFT